MILVRTCLFAALGGFLFGYDLGLIGGALLPIQRYFNMTGSIDLGLVVGAAKIGAAAGTFLGGAAMARYGRQRALAANSLAFTMGPLIMALATGPWMLVLGRLIVGLGIGVSAVVSPAYIAELAPAGSRGALVQLYEVMLCVGMLAAPLVDWALSGGDERSHAWRLMVGIPAVPGLLLAAAPLFLPESPRWLVMRNRLDEALHVLTAVLRGSERPGSWRQSWGWSSEYERLVAARQRMLASRSRVPLLVAAAARAAGQPRQRNAPKGGAESETRRCPCGSGETYRDCCGPIIAGAWSRTAPELARARFTAIVLGDAKALTDTTHPEALAAIGTKQSLRKKMEKLMRRMGSDQAPPALTDSVHAQDPEDPDAWIVMLAFSLLSTDPTRDSTPPYVAIERYVKHNGRWLYFGPMRSFPMLKEFAPFVERYPASFGEEDDFDGTYGPYRGMYEYNWMVMSPRPSQHPFTAATAAFSSDPLGSFASAASQQLRQSPLGPGWLADGWPTGEDKQEPGGWVYLDRALDPLTGLTAAQLAARTQQALEAAEFNSPAPSAGSSGPRPGSLSPAEEAVVHEAEDELLLLWSSVEADRGAVLERRRQVWRARQQKRAAAAARPGRLGRWARSILLGRPRAPSLDPIPEETHSRTASYASSPSRPGTAPGSPAARWSWSSDGRSLPRGLSPASSLHAPLGSGPDPGPGLGTAGPRQGQGYGHGHSNGADAGPGPGPGSEQGLRHGLLTSAVGSGSSGGASEPEPGRRPGSPRAGSGAARSLFGSKVKGGGAGGGGRSEGGGAGAYAPLAGAASVTAGGRRGRDADAESGESSRLLPLPVSAEARAWGEEREEPASDPEPSAADLPGEEGSLLRTLTAMMYDIAGLAGGPEARALWLALGLAFFDQATASTAIINYGPTLMRRMQQAAAAAAAAAVAGGPPSVGPPASPALGVAGSAGLGEALTAGDLGPDGAGGGGWTGGDGGALLLSVAIGAAKAVGVVAALLMVDRFGRRPLLIAGSLTGAAALAGVAAAQAYDNAAAVGWALCAFTLTFSVSWAGLYWVVVSELFSMPAKSAGSSAATCLLFLTGAGTDLVFLSLQDAMGHGSFVLFAVISLASGAYVWALLPETKGRQLTEVTAMLSSEGGRKGGGGAGAASEVGWVQLRERRR
ncbi:hypothetical protein HYH03_012034 [Edaphochlamys debaryana]|uniref:Major facilitator superfamily (MFS) profile domain-containing protein n=1 Tax=Edaphochlamys debaryana TaxID=47281 RepID=A0A835XQS1_9CHLO|nr:hypothetical protein HYH03_012034 [Edaphochlamys debaryana]|eukprot:KAG2489392.1 hypothetical protein HYH03_012034 [Edaphochlamys debaryana]